MALTDSFALIITQTAIQPTYRIIAGRTQSVQPGDMWSVQAEYTLGSPNATSFTTISYSFTPVGGNTRAATGAEIPRDVLLDPTTPQTTYIPTSAGSSYSSPVPAGPETVQYVTVRGQVQNNAPAGRLHAVVGIEDPDPND